MKLFLERQTILLLFFTAKSLPVSTGPEGPIGYLPPKQPGIGSDLNLRMRAATYPPTQSDYRAADIYCFVETT